jgi:uncharacterized protein YjbI with pentapeptide repeats
MPRNNIKPTSKRIRNRVLQVCAHGECVGHRVWDFQTCWEHLTPTERDHLKTRVSNILRSGDDLKGIVLSGADLSNFDFSGADLTNAFLDHCNLAKSKFVDTNLHEAYLGWANLKGARLERAEIDRAVFSGANLEGADLLAYSLRFGRVPINLEKSSFGKDGLFRRPHIDEADPPCAEATYRALKAYFLSDGDYDSASWASYCERVMQRSVRWRQKAYLNWVTSLLFGLACGYGEKPKRVFLASTLLIVIYALLYYGLNLIKPVGELRHVTLWESLYFSGLSFSGMTFGELLPQNGAFARLLVTTEAFGGIFALSLFVFTLTKRYVAR